MHGSSLVRRFGHLKVVPSKPGDRDVSGRGPTPPLRGEQVRRDLLQRDVLAERAAMMRGSHSYCSLAGETIALACWPAGSACRPPPGPAARGSLAGVATTLAANLRAARPSSHREDSRSALPTRGIVDGERR